MKKTIILTAIVTACVIMTGYFVYTTIMLNKKVTQHEAVLKQVVDFLNKQVAEKTPVTTQ